MKIEMTVHELKEKFGVNFTNELLGKVLDICGTNYYVWQWSINYCGHYFHNNIVNLELYEYEPPKPKSKEEIAAENAVQKAEEALKAAKSVLEKVKESK